MTCSALPVGLLPSQSLTEYNKPTSTARWIISIALPQRIGAHLGCLLPCSGDIPLYLGLGCNRYHVTITMSIHHQLKMSEMESPASPVTSTSTRHDGLHATVIFHISNITNSIMCNKFIHSQLQCYRLNEDFCSSSARHLRLILMTFLKIKTIGICFPIPPAK